MNKINTQKQLLRSHSFPSPTSKLDRKEGRKEGDWCPIDRANVPWAKSLSNNYCSVESGNCDHSEPMNLDCSIIELTHANKATRTRRRRRRRRSSSKSSKSSLLYCTYVVDEKTKNKVLMMLLITLEEQKRDTSLMEILSVLKDVFQSIFPHLLDGRSRW